MNKNISIISGDNENKMMIEEMVRRHSPKLRSMDLGERINHLRTLVAVFHPDKDYYSYKVMAERIGSTPQTISAVERGVSKNPSFQTVVSIMNDLGLSLLLLNDETYTATH